MTPQEVALQIGIAGVITSISGVLHGYLELVGTHLARGEICMEYGNISIEA